jgi:hypothetical protein
MQSYPVLRPILASMILAAGMSGFAAAANPLSDAVATWPRGDNQDASGRGMSLSIVGKVQLGVSLVGAEREASLRRGGDGRVARFEGGYLRAGCSPGSPLAIAGKEMTLYVRLQDPNGTWNTPLLAKDDANDTYGVILYGDKESLSYTWRTEPLERRTVGMPGLTGKYGFNGEGNDQHELAVYQAGKFAVSTLTVDENGLVVVWHNGRKSSGTIDAGKQNVGTALFRVGAKHSGTEVLDGDIAEILVYDRQITDQARIRIEGTLNNKWGLGSAAPTTAALAIPSQGLVLHLDADDVNADHSKPGAPGPLAVWKDKSAAGRTVTQNVPDKRPELVPGTLAHRAVVRFGGRQWLDGQAPLPAGCKQFTLIAVWKRNHTDGSEVVMEQSSPGVGRRACLLSTGSGGRSRTLSRELSDGVLRLHVPVALVNPTRWHDVAARFRGPNLKLFVDGVLVDEEWPHGALYQFCAPFLIGAGYENGRLKTGFQGLVDHVALWNRALRDDEIVVLAGGADEVARRDREMYGPVQTSMQYWKPRGYNAWAGDCMPFFHDGTFHLFYLFDRHHHGSKWHQGAHQYAHFSTRDLIHWESHPLAVPIVQQWECAMGTGDCIWRDGVYHMFYTDCGARCEYEDKPQRGSWIFCATSTDGVHFHKDLKPLVPGGDCTVFQDPATSLFHMIRGGGNRLVSKDLRNWEETPGDFVRRKEGTSGECPHLFPWNGWFYFILGTNAIWKSRSALGPWEEMKPTIYDGLYVPKVAEFTGNRRILAGFLAEHGWGGHLALRELIQYADGSLGTRFPPELIPPSGAPLKLAFRTLRAGVSDDRQQVTIRGGEKFGAGMLEGMPHDVRITLRVVPQPGAKRFGLCLRGRGDYEAGCELRFEPARRLAQYGDPVNRGLARDSKGRVAGGRDYAIQDVEHLDRPFNLEIIVKGDIIDTCIDGRRTMITRRDPQPEGDRLFFFAEAGTVTFQDIVVRPLCR